MERKRKLPARATRSEHVSKKRTLTPSDDGANTPAPVAAPPAVDEAPPPQPLPKAIQPGKPLPTVGEAQPDDLPASQYQSVQESGVLAESLHRSRQRWISEGIFEKYWTKPVKRKGVVIEEPNNPAKDTMMKLGQVTITVEPHVFEATMFAVKDPKPPPPPPTTVRPVIQYGPPNGTMPPPPIPTPKSTPSATPVPPPSSQSPSQTPTLASAQPPQQQQQQQPVSQNDAPRPPTATAAPGPAATTTTPQQASQPAASPRGMESVLSPSTATPQIASRPATVPVVPPPPPSSAQSPAAAPPPVAATAAVPLQHQHQHQQPPIQGHPAGGMSAPLQQQQQPPPQHHTGPIPPSQSPALGKPPPGLQANNAHPPPPHPKPNGAPPAAAAAAAPPRAPGGPATTTAAANHPPGTDPIILTLAERATDDPQLRDLMKRVANGHAPKAELERFQAIIDQITAENKRKGIGQGPSADRLIVDGRTVRYFAEEVRAILDIVLASNPKQTSADLRPPAGSDPLVVHLVKAALDDSKVRDMVRRIAENHPQFNDATDLKMTLDTLKNRVARERMRTQSPSVATTTTTNIKASPGPSSHPPPTPTTPTTASSQPQTSSSSSASASTAQPPPPPPPALRSKGPPPPPPKPVFAAIVFEFAGGSGDRYLFPKFSVLEHPAPTPPPPPPPSPAAHLQQQPGAAGGSPSNLAAAPATTPATPAPPHNPGQTVIASFLIVRKGSTSEYGGDPDLDYYQPVTIKLHAANHRFLDSLARVVAPIDEVKRYMDDVMNNMTRAEYVLLAMRLPRKEKPDDTKDEKDQQQQQQQGKDKEAGTATSNTTTSNGVAANGNGGELQIRHVQPMQGVLWTTKSGNNTPSKGAAAAANTAMSKDGGGEEEQYQKFIASVTPKKVEEV